MGYKLVLRENEDKMELVDNKNMKALKIRSCDLVEEPLWVYLLAFSLMLN